MDTCLFCKIANRECPGKIVYEDEQSVAFEDIHPKAPIHILIVPRQHLATILDATQTDDRLLGHLLLVANRIARQIGIADRGFRLVINCNNEGGQAVYHLHLHLLGGRPLSWHPA
ncbi:MAG: histidine triad nucleotide-binding protein [candidate division NC10 bacterium]|nr:histidine triad nucleotide-binding protein [candidate division NC10 bacterium]MDE2322446.1 histidine triad nucleotide-binding protein [candidate division NC10 bacterium]